MALSVKASKIRRIIISICLAISVFCIGWVAVDCSSPANLYIPSCGISVQCQKMILATSEHLQSVIDKPHIAAMYGRYILDHAGQEFDGLWEIQVDDMAYIDGQQYICTFITTGWSDMGIRANSGDLPNADMYLCTCVPEGRPYEICIIGIDKRGLVDNPQG